MTNDQPGVRHWSLGFGHRSIAHCCLVIPCMPVGERKALRPYNDTCYMPHSAAFCFSFPTSFVVRRSLPVSTCSSSRPKTTPRLLNSSSNSKSTLAKGTRCRIVSPFASRGRRAFRPVERILAEPDRRIHHQGHQEHQEESVESVESVDESGSPFRAFPLSCFRVSDSGIRGQVPS